jgi:ATP-dependent protease HslVU (ClpYQ) peptidase subunit
MSNFISGFLGTVAAALILTLIERYIREKVKQDELVADFVNEIDEWNE